MATEVATVDAGEAGANNAPQKHESGVQKLHNLDHPGDTELIEQWTRTDSMVVSWLLNSMIGNISNAFIHTKSAKTLWITLNERYGICNGPLLYQLEREIASAMQGDLRVLDYFTKLHMLWDELVQLRPLPECTCGSACTCNVAKATSDLVEERHLMQFLMGLNDEYDNMRN
ncbi:UNVERIFIED_CONTAM: hypothetical protein Sradi_1875600 [Sesamum radiatum]|uniref:Retrotransposon gag domain-containing protein n=1 Tax=Sesamum radiatum TaxID=300843 RepID=A0AAW2TXY3_SESRA